MTGHTEFFDLFFLKSDQAKQFFLVARHTAGKQLSAQSASFFENIDRVAALGCHPGHIQTAGAPSDHHDSFRVAGGHESHFFFAAQHRIDQAFNAAFAKDGFHAGVAGDAATNFVQTTFSGFIGHLRIG